MRIAISPDENPGDPGTTADPTITERDLNLKVAGALQAALQRCGQDAWFDPSIGYVERVARANGDGTHLLVACAHNAGGGSGTVFVFCPGGHASQTPTWSDGSPNRQDQLAQAIGDQLVADGVSPRWSVYDESVYECCSFALDTAYVEFLFMDNPGDQQRYHDPAYPGRAAEATAKAIASVFGFAYVSPDPPAPPAPAPAPVDPAAALQHVLTAEKELWAARKELGG